VINILTRTSKRPEAFQQCYRSILSQTYRKINWIVSVHDDESFEYASKLCKNVIRVEEKEHRSEYKNRHEPYNSYINNLLEAVEDGYIMFLDDDDYFTSPTSLEKVVPHLEEDKLLTWLVMCQGNLIPDEGALKAPVLIPTMITASSFMFHSKHKWAAKWDSVKGADYRCVQRLSWLLNYKWLHEVIVTIPTAHEGMRE